MQRKRQPPKHIIPVLNLGVNKVKMYEKGALQVKNSLYQPVW